MQNEIKYGTSDFPLASYLDYAGFKIVALEQVDERRKEFIFVGDGIRETVDAFYAGETLVKPLAYMDSMKKLKSLMYNRGTFNQV